MSQTETCKAVAAAGADGGNAILPVFHVLLWRTRRFRCARIDQRQDMDSNSDLAANSATEGQMRDLVGPSEAGSQLLSLGISLNLEVSIRERRIRAFRLGSTSGPPNWTKSRAFIRQTQ